MGRQFTAAERASILGSSDKAALACALFLNKPVYGRTPYMIWAGKVGLQLEAKASTQAVFDKGHGLEDFVRARYSALTGRQVIAREATIRDKQHSFLVTHLDSETQLERPNRIVELKTVQGRFNRSDDDDELDAWGEPGTDAVPAYINYQAQDQMGLRGLPLNDIAALVNGRGFEPLIYTVSRHEPLYREIRDMAIDWWQTYVVPFQARGELIAPPKMSWDDCVHEDPLSWSNSQRADAKESVRLTFELVAKLQRLGEIKSAYKQLEEEEEAIKVAIRTYIGEAEILLSPDGLKLATFKGQVRRGGYQEEALVKLVSDLLSDQLPGTPESVVRERAQSLLNECRGNDSFPRPLLLSKPSKAKSSNKKGAQS